jgi:hypothetical protein
MTLPRLATAGFLAAWATACTAVGAALMRSHWVPLPVPPAQSGPPVDAHGWTALHVLAAECGCSHRVLAHLRRRGPEPDVRERILWVTDRRDLLPTPPPGFEVECLTAEELVTTYSIEAVPVLVLSAPDESVRYRGGYTARKQGLDVQDRRILSAVRGGEPVVALPVYGCATSDRLKAATAFFPARARGDTP